MCSDRNPASFVQSASYFTDIQSVTVVCHDQNFILCWFNLLLSLTSTLHLIPANLNPFSYRDVCPLDRYGDGRGGAGGPLPRKLPPAAREQPTHPWPRSPHAPCPARVAAVLRPCSRRRRVSSELCRGCCFLPQIHHVVAPAGSTLVFFESLLHSGGSGVTYNGKERVLILCSFLPTMYQAWNDYNPYMPFVRHLPLLLLRTPACRPLARVVDCRCLVQIETLNKDHQALFTGSRQYNSGRRGRDLAAPREHTGWGLGNTVPP